MATFSKSLFASRPARLLHNCNPVLRRGAHFRGETGAKGTWFCGSVGIELGATGSGKSTLLGLMAWQDLTFGNGVAVIDPHGDLIDRLIPHLPPERWDDVVLFDPADEEFAVAFNPLAPGSGRERDLRATDFIAVMKRHTSGWGDQMSSLLGNAVLAFLHSERGGTLPELRRFLVDPAFRTGFLKSVTHGEVLH